MMEIAGGLVFWALLIASVGGVLAYLAALAKHAYESF